MESVESDDYVKMEVTIHGIKKIEEWELMVKLRESKVRINPFRKTIHSFNIIAIILSFTGRRSDVCNLLQLLNHESRAYIVQQNGLSGFL